MSTTSVFPLESFDILLMHISGDNNIVIKYFIAFTLMKVAYHGKDISVLNNLSPALFEFLYVIDI